MHEASIALNVLDIAEENCKKAGRSRIDLIRLRIGRASNILPDALAFAFNALKSDTIAKDAELLIDVVPLSGSCKACGCDFKTEESYILNCPLCGSDSFVIKEGYEMQIVDIEVEEDD